MADRQYARLLADVLSFGWVLPASIAAGAGLGWLADRALGSFPVATAVLGLLGFAGGVLQLYREMVELSSRGREEDKGGPKPGGGAPP
ncbi:MAG TPA: AtpZ/AtpI family protein [Thermoanaerobaculia bacterium]|nr:AtpZ/AtpI family protein [Thermoanaerobaculia bacterium]HQR68088.1 AtpZ/AtpI family protein [Thermoanaerobaculia bacterium]